LRGAGGYLLDGAKQRFMFNYDPRGERATRDLVSQSMYREMIAGRTTPNGGLYISMGHLGPEKVRKQFKGMVERCADCGFDLAGGLVEVVPTAHYLMGGVVVKVDTSTEVTGLYCAGEDAGGVHGANRLGGNGVANSTVYGGIAGETMAADIRRGLGAREPDMDAVKAAMEAADAPFRAPAAGGQPKAQRSDAPAAGGQPKARGDDVNRIRDTLLSLMWDDVGIIREKAGMERALGRLEALEGELAGAGIADRDRAFNLSWHDWLNLRSQLAMSKVVARAALQRENSRGAHFREDFKEPGDLAASRFTIVRKLDGKLDVSDEAVEFTRVQPGETLLKDQPRAAE
jgi:fumarate reductase flavoprotein subunit